MKKNGDEADVNDDGEDGDSDREDEDGDELVIKVVVDEIE